VTFLHEWFLVGLGASLVPLLLHIVQTRRIRKVYFSTLFFLKMIHKQRSLRIRLSRLLLLLVRMGLAAMITLVFAQPYFTTASLAFMNPGPRIVGAVWDNSGATRATDSRLSVIEKLKTRFADFVSTLSDKDTLVVVCTSPAPRMVYRGPPSNFQMSSLPGPTLAGADRPRSLEMVSDFFKANPSSETLLAIFSDFRKTAWPQDSIQRVKAFRTLLFPWRLATYANWAITNVEFKPPVVAVGEPVVANVTLRYCTSGPNVSTTLTVQADGRTIDKRTMAASTEPIFSQISINGLKEGLHRLTFRLSPDNLDLDDERETEVRVLPYRHVLLVNGKKRANPSQDEGYFLRKILGTSAAPKKGLLTKEVFELSLSEDLRDYQTIVLTGVKTLPAPIVEKLSKFVESGGSCLVFLGDQVDVESYNSGILGWTGLALSRRVDSTGGPRAGSGDGGLFASIFDPLFWQSVIVDRYFLCLRKGKTEGVSIPLTMPDGTPMLIVVQKGSGAALFVNTASTLESGDLPLHPIFPILVGESIRVAVGAPIQQYSVGQRIVLNLGQSELDAVLSVQGPGGRITTLKPTHVGASLGVVFEETHRPGVYRFMRQTRDGARSTAFVVEPPAVESDLTPLAPATVSLLWPEAVVCSDDKGAKAPTVMTTRVFSFVDLLLFLAVILVTVELYLVWDLERQIQIRAELVRAQVRA